MEEKLMWSFIAVITTIWIMNVIVLSRIDSTLDRAKAEIIEQCSK